MAAASPATSASSNALSEVASGCSRLAIISTSSGEMCTTVVGARRPHSGDGGRRRRRPHRALGEPEQRDERVGCAGDHRGRLLAGHESCGEVKPDLGLALALLGSAAGLVEAPHRPAEHCRGCGEHDQRGEVVRLLHVEAARWLGEEVVQRHESGDRAGDRGRAPEQGRDQRSEEQEQRGSREVGVEGTRTTTVVAPTIAQRRGPPHAPVITPDVTSARPRPRCCSRRPRDG